MIIPTENKCKISSICGWLNSKFNDFIKYINL